MKDVTFTGVVEANPAVSEGNGQMSCVDGPSIGGIKLIPALEEAWPVWEVRQHLTVVLARGGDVTAHATGRLDANEGDQGWSSWTPGYEPTLEIGGLNLLEKLNELDGDTVTLRVDDGPREG